MSQDRPACPFCGSKDLSIKVNKTYNNKLTVYNALASVKCRGCGARGPGAIGRLPYMLFTPKVETTTKEQLEALAWEKWKKRGRWIAPEGDFSDDWKCSVCGEEWYCEREPFEMGLNYCPNCGAHMIEVEE